MGKGALQQMLCKAVLFQFLQHRRAALGLTANQPPLWVWEARRANEYHGTGQVEELVKYLAGTEIHIQLGPERSVSLPGARLPERTVKRLREERRMLVREAGLGECELKEDAVIRVFLDGRLSWPSVRDLLGDVPSMLSRAAA